ncbi:MAG: hypothetical protein ACRKGH_07190 [Dehalogenimonas sp.]
MKEIALTVSVVLFFIGVIYSISYGARYGLNVNPDDKRHKNWLLLGRIYGVLFYGSIVWTIYAFTRDTGLLIFMIVGGVLGFSLGLYVIIKYLR